MTDITLEDIGKSQWSYMALDEATEMIRTERALAQVRAERPELVGDELLNEAIRSTGRDPGYSNVELCHHCGALYHRDWDGEYVDPIDDEDRVDLAHWVGVDIDDLEPFVGEHFCDGACVRAAVEARRSK